jgi:hypothetical protein
MRQNEHQFWHWNELSGSTFILTSQVTTSFSTIDVFNLVQSQCSAFRSFMITFFNSVVSTFHG